MKRHSFLAIVATFLALIIVSCGSGNSPFNSDASQYRVRYEVQFNSPGAIKIAHKDNSGNEIVADPVTVDWEREYSFGDRVDAFLEVEASEVSPSSPVLVRLAIFINGNRVQQATSTITHDKKSNLATTRP